MLLTIKEKSLTVKKLFRAKLIKFVDCNINRLFSLVDWNSKKNVKNAPLIIYVLDIKGNGILRP